jgi:hypothetical protein
MPDVVKFSPEIGEILALSRGFAFFPVHFAQTLRKVKPKFRLRGFERECGVPRSATGPIEAAALGTRVGEGCVYDMPVGDSEHQFKDRDTRQKIRFPQQPFIGRPFKLE